MRPSLLLSFVLFPPLSFPFSFCPSLYSFFLSSFLSHILDPFFPSFLPNLLFPSFLLLSLLSFLPFLLPFFLPLPPSLHSLPSLINSLTSFHCLTAMAPNTLALWQLIPHESTVLLASKASQVRTERNGDADATRNISLWAKHKTTLQWFAVEWPSPMMGASISLSTGKRWY